MTTSRIAEQRVSAEGQEGMRAFLEKRKPKWVSRDASRSHRQPRRDRHPDRAGLSRGGHRERRGLLRCGRRRAARARGRPGGAHRPGCAGGELSLRRRAHRGGGRDLGADAIHPGYGFLSENPRFARACARAGLIFIGPPADVIERMGSKIGARALDAGGGRAGRPGRDAARSVRRRACSPPPAALGYPVLVKASAGGGGKGMRVVPTTPTPVESIAAARREAAAAFGDGTLYVERLIERPRHVEIQVFADAHGNVVHLFERECSVQRRHQKIVEESPSPVAHAGASRGAWATPRSPPRARPAIATRARSSSCSRARATSARFYFLEMNTRLQVEHPVTEAVDRRRSRPRADRRRRRRAAAVDAGRRCRSAGTRSSAASTPRIRPRIPSAGRTAAALPRAAGPWHPRRFRRRRGRHGRRQLRSAAREAHRPRRDARGRAIARALGALRAFPMLGIRTNIPFLIDCSTMPAFRGRTPSHRFDRGAPGASSPTRDVPPEALAAAALATGTTTTRAAVHGAAVAEADPWSTLRRWGR